MTSCDASKWTPMTTQHRNRDASASPALCWDQHQYYWQQQKTMLAVSPANSYFCACAHSRHGQEPWCQQTGWQPPCFGSSTTQHDFFTMVHMEHLRLTGWTLVPTSPFCLGKICSTAKGVSISFWRCAKWSLKRWVGQHREQSCLSTTRWEHTTTGFSWWSTLRLVMQFGRLRSMCLRDMSPVQHHRIEQLSSWSAGCRTSTTWWPTSRKGSATLSKGQTAWLCSKCWMATLVIAEVHGDPTTVNQYTLGNGFGWTYQQPLDMRALCDLPFHHPLHCAGRQSTEYIAQDGITWFTYDLQVRTNGYKAEHGLKTPACGHQDLIRRSADVGIHNT